MTLSAETFAYVADLVRRRSAIQLGTGKEYLVESRLLPLSRAAGVADVDTYVRSLRDAAHPGGLDLLVEAMTTNETSWFRDNQPFEALAGHVVPELLAERSPWTAGQPVRIWSAACSSGQEPYSIAMTLADVLPQGLLRITATDLSEQMIARAAAGRYSQLEINRGLPASMLVKHFTRVGAEWQIAPEIRSTVSFLRHNLLDDPPVGGPFDTVFLRNVLIYFDLETKRDVLRKVRQVIRPGGFLVLGSAETTIGIDEDWQRVAVGRGAVYRLEARRAA